MTLASRPKARKLTQGRAACQSAFSLNPIAGRVSIESLPISGVRGLMPFNRWFKAGGVFCLEAASGFQVVSDGQAWLGLREGGDKP